MTNSKATRKALFMSVLSLLLCFTMLMGATFAWFTDTVTSTNNIIKSGNLDIELYYQLEGEAADKWTKVTKDSNIFKEGALWEPGYTEVVKLKAVNEGSLALKYQLGVNVAEEVMSTNVDGGTLKLSDHIKFGLVEGSETYNRDTAIAAVDAKATPLAAAYTSDIISLYPENYTGDDASATYPQEKVVTLVVYMPTTVDNVANHAKDADVPTINLGLNVSATQLVAEMDSFDNTYDEGAPLYNLPTNVTEDSFGENVAYYNGVYFSSLTDALTAVHNAGGTDNALYLKPNADLGAVTHAHVCSNLTVYGNDAHISGGERDFEIGIPQTVSCTIDSPVNLTVNDLNGCAVWGTIPQGTTVNISLKNCEDVSKVMLPNYTTGDYNLSVLINDCTFTGTDSYNDSAIWCRGLDSLSITGTTFKNYAVGLNQNNKDSIENYILTDCTFIDCATATNVTTQTAYAAPVRAVASNAGAVTNLVMNNCEFVYTTDETAINGDVLTYQDGDAGKVNVTVDGVEQ